MSAMTTSLPTDDEFKNALAALVRAENASAEDVIRIAVLERYQRMLLMQATVDTGTDRRAGRLADVLDRLGKA